MNIKNPDLVLVQSIEDRCGFNQYQKTLSLRKVNVAADKDYQKNFTGYYRVRRDKKWLQSYYEFMEQHKNDDPLTFEEVLRYLSSVPHRVTKTIKNKSGMAATLEVSFSSKMLATINPNYPIWDSQVVKALGIEVDDEVPTETRLVNYVKAYAKLKKEVDDFIPTAEGQECIRLHDELFPDFKDINPVKKIDFYLWSLGK